MKLQTDMYTNHKCRDCYIINKNILTNGIGSRGEWQQVCLEAQEGPWGHSKSCHKRSSRPSGISPLGERDPLTIIAVSKSLQAVRQKEGGAD